MSQTFSSMADKAIKSLSSVILGKERQLKLALTSIFSNGHLLIEDLPGMGKTTLSQALSKVLGLSYQRIQFTSDLLPSDIVGASIFEQKEGVFRFHPGPVFSQVVLADELNRATPKSQSALLEAMEEGQVSIDGDTHQLPNPFFVIATQNPQSQTGTFPLPESQLDRFLLRFSLGYPDAIAEKELLKGNNGRTSLNNIKPIFNPETLNKVQQQVKTIHATDSLVDYIHRLVSATRQDESFQLGLSPRGALALMRAAQAWALLEGRGHVMPEDVQAVFVPVAGHRIIGRHEVQGDQLARQLLNKVDVVA